MIRDSINGAIDYLYNSCQVELVLELIRDSLSEDIIDKDSVSDILKDIALEESEQSLIEQAIEIMRDFEIEISNEVKHRQFTRDIEYRLSEIVRYVQNEDLSKIAESRINGIIYDLSEYLNQLSDS